MTEVLVLIVTGTIAGLLTTEAHAWLPHLSRAVVRRSCRLLPSDMKWFEEAMLADLAEYEDRPLTMLGFAVRCWKNGRLMGREARSAAPEVSDKLTPLPVLQILGILVLLRLQRYLRPVIWGIRLVGPVGGLVAAFETRWLLAALGGAICFGEMIVIERGLRRQAEWNKRWVAAAKEKAGPLQ